MLSLGLFFAGLWILLLLTLVGLLVLVMVGVATARSEPDPHNHRLPATYLSAVSFVLVFTLLFGVTAAVASVASLIEDSDVYSVGAVESFELRTTDTLDEDHTLEEEDTLDEDDVELEEEFDAGQADDDFLGPEDSDVEDAVAGALAALFLAGAAGTMFWRCRRTLLDLVERDGFRQGPGARTVHAYLYATQFVAVLLLVGAGAIALYGLAQIVVPGVLSEADAQQVREGGARLLVTAGALAAGSAAIAALHTREHDRVDNPPAADLPPTTEPIA